MPKVTSDTELVGGWPAIRFLALSPITFITYALFCLVYWMKDQKFSVFMICPIQLIFGLINISHNWVACSFMFLEFPKEFFTTTRLRRHKTSEDAWRRELADMLGGFLNSQDPGHY